MFQKQSGLTVHTEGSPWRLLLLFSLPLMAGNIFQQMYTVVDTAVVGRVLGVDALAALGTVDWLNWLTLGTIQGFTQGFSILMAQRFGAGDFDRLRKAAASAILLSALCGILLTAGSEAIAEPVTALLRVPAEIRPIAVDYLRVLFAGLPVVTAYNLAASMLRALGDGRTPLIAMVAASLTNIALDFWFVMGFRWGVQGAAAATIIAQCLAAGCCILRLCRVEALRLKKEDWSFDGPLWGLLMKLGLPMALQNTIIAVGGMIIQTIVNGFSVAFIAGFTATNKLYGVLEVAATSYGYAMTTYAGQNLGAGKLERISQGMRSGLVIALATSAAISAAMLGGGQWVLSWFIPTGTAQSGEALEVALRYLSLMSVCLPVLYVLHLTRSCIQGLGNTLLPMVSGISEFIMRTGGALLLPTVLEGTGVMCAEVLAWLGADLILVPSYFYVMNKVRRLQTPEKGAEQS